MKPQLSIKREYKSCRFKFDDLLKIAQEATSFMEKGLGKDAYSRFRYTIGLTGGRELTTDLCRKFEGLLYEYGSSDLEKIEIDLYSNDDEFHMSFNYKYASVTTMDLRLSSRRDSIYALDESIQRKIHSTSNKLFTGVAYPMLISMAMSVALSLNLALFLSWHTKLSSTAIVAWFWLTIISTFATYNVANEIILINIYPPVVILGNEKFNSKGRDFGKDFRRFWVWCIVLITGSTILSVLHLR